MFMIEYKNRPRVLVTTVGPWSSILGSDTMSSLMKEYGAENVACLYIRASKSDSKSASRYFHIIEGRIIKSILKRNIKTGEEFSPEEVHISEVSEEQATEIERYSKFKKKRLGIFILARELVWILGKWRTHELNAFLDDFNPKVLICPIESYIHFNTLNEYIIKRYNPKVIGFLWDDNFTYKQEPFNFWHQLHRFWLRRSVKQIVRKCSTVFALSPKMKEECDKEFGINSQLLTKPIFNQGKFVAYEPNNPIRILYTGNLYVGRDKTIMAISEALRIVNRENVKVTLDIYTQSIISQKSRSKIEIDGICRIHKPIPQSEVFKLQSETDVLLFVESLEKYKHQGARLSFSTKITDYFSSGRCIWAVGSQTLGPIDYLSRMDAALMSFEKKSIISTLNRMINDTSLIKTYAQKSFKCGKEHHNAEKILSKFYNTIIG